MLDLKYAPEGSRDLHGCMDRMLWGMPKKTFCLRLFFAIKKPDAAGSLSRGSFKKQKSR